jgi:disulfide bond formation protein DsbB
MSVDAVTLFFALLALVAGLSSAAAVGSVLSGDRFGLWAALRPLAVEFAAAVAVTATAGSLYLSEVVGYTPCQLCWVQRAFMYPAALALVGAALTRRPVLAWVGGGLAAIGLPIAIFHRYDQAVGGAGGVCDEANPCSLKWVEEFGFVTIPTMAALGFLAIATFVALHHFTDPERA